MAGCLDGLVFRSADGRVNDDDDDDDGGRAREEQKRGRVVAGPLVVVSSFDFNLLILVWT